MSTLILHLPLAPPGPATSYRYTLTTDGHSVSGHGSAVAALLPQPSRAAGEVVAVVPARALSWQRVTLPLGVGPHAPRLRAVLEGLLEEVLLDEPASLHLALAPDARPEQATWVAVCERAWLQAHLQALEAAGRPVNRIVPEAAPGPSANGQPQACAQGTPEDAHWLLSAYGPQQAVLVLPWSATPLVLAQEGVVLSTEPAVAALAEQSAARSVPLLTHSQAALQAARSPWDLAQMDLASSGRTRALRKLGTGLGALLRAPQWRPARWGSAALLALHLLGLNVWAWQERQALAQAQGQIRRALTDTFPHITVVVDAPLQMERELARLRQAAGAFSPGDVEPLLAAAAAALPSQWQASRIEYSPGQLRLHGPRLSATEQAQADNLARSQRYRLQWDSDSVLLRPAGDTP